MRIRSRRRRDHISVSTRNRNIGHISGITPQLDADETEHSQNTNDRNKQREFPHISHPQRSVWHYPTGGENQPGSGSGP